MGSNGVGGVLLAFALASGGIPLTAGYAAADVQCGKAAWYDLEGLTASGEASDSSLMAAAHRTLPFQTRVKVENLANGRSVVVRINDRGPFVGGRIIDVTRAAAEKLGFVNAGVTRVRVTVVDDDGTDSEGACGSVADTGGTGSAGARTVAARTVSGGTVSVGYVESAPEPETAVPADFAESDATDPAAATLPADGEAGPALAAVPSPPPKPRREIAPRGMMRSESLAQRFRDAFAPDYTTVDERLPLGYAPVDGE